MLRIEILAEGVKGLAAERVKTWGREVQTGNLSHRDRERGCPVNPAGGGLYTVEYRARLG